MIFSFPGQKCLHQFSEPLLCGHRGWNEGAVHKPTCMDIVWELLSGHGHSK